MSGEMRPVLNLGLTQYQTQIQVEFVSCGFAGDDGWVFELFDDGFCDEGFFDDVGALPDF
jgi:hypothetical protein